MNAPMALETGARGLVPDARPSGLVAAWHCAGSIDPALAAAWDALASDASEPAVFAERWCLGPALDNFDRSGGVQLLTLWHADGRLIGVMPLIVASHYGPMPRRHVTNWRHANAFHGAPLVRAGFEEAFWHAALGALDDAPFATAFVHIAQLTADAPLHRALMNAAAAQGRPCDEVHSQERAMLKSDLSPDAYWEAAVRGKKRKELRRQANRLADLGGVDFRRWQAGEPIEAWVDAFLTLERAGWKGENGSALISSADTEAWFRAVMAGAAAQPAVLDMRALDLDGRPIAMLISFYRGGGGFSFKTSFDEELARFSPGVLLQQANLDVLARGDVDWVDSCAAPDHPMIDSLWMERRRLVWVNVPLAGAWNRASYGIQMKAETVWRGFRSLRLG